MPATHAMLNPPADGIRPCATAGKFVFPATTIIINSRNRFVIFSHVFSKGAADE
jgi:hypothetical protein